MPGRPNKQFRKFAVVAAPKELFTCLSLMMHISSFRETASLSNLRITCWGQRQKSIITTLDAFESDRPISNPTERKCEGKQCLGIAEAKREPKKRTVSDHLPAAL